MHLQPARLPYNKHGSRLTTYYIRRVACLSQLLRYILHLYFPILPVRFAKTPTIAKLQRDFRFSLPSAQSIQFSQFFLTAHKTLSLIQFVPDIVTISDDSYKILFSFSLFCSYYSRYRFVKFFFSNFRVRERFSCFI